MPITKNTYLLEIDDTGGAYSISNDIAERYDTVLIVIASGDTGTLSGNVTVTATNGTFNGYYNIEFKDVFDLNSNSFTLFGETVTEVQAANNPRFIVRDNGSSFEVYLQANSLGVTVESSNLAPKSVNLAAMADLPQGAILVGNSSDRPSQLDASASGRIPIGDGSDLNMQSISGDATLASNGALTIANDAVDNNKLANIPQGSIKIGGASNAPTDLDVSAAGAIPIGDGTDVNAVVVSGVITINSAGVAAFATDSVTNTVLANMTEGTVKVGGALNAPTDLDNSTAGALIIGTGSGVASQVMSGDGTLSSGGALTIAAGAITASKVSNNLKYDTFILPVSFESGEQGDYDIYFDFDGTLISYKGFAATAIAGTDNGTITAKNNAGSSMSSGVMTFSAADPRTSVYEVNPSTNNGFTAGDKLTFTTAKVTAGGTVLLYLKVLRS